VTCLSNGICQAAQPIISTNFGAGLPERIDHVRRLGLRTALLICAVPTILGLAVPNLFTYIFLNPDANVLALAPTAVRLYFTGFLITGVNMFLIGYFQSTVKPAYALFLCLMRGCILSIVFVKLLPLLFGLNGIWISVPLAELFTLLTGVLFLRNSLHASASRSGRTGNAL
jgi:Na+-driven multidrug efflux pump